ncbi:MAG: DUF1670 domain-containing protein [Candidatus Izemoplasma sp.]|nr:DUF1670 domain-containing protein [Candidatus Izemoplasma sp.]
MITLIEKHNIIRMYLEGNNKSEIARQIRIIGHTVKKYIRDYE